jgi:very-short-patch-repair endonuclease
MGTVTPRKLREATGEALREAMSAAEVEQFCTGIGLAPPNPPDDVAFNSKRAYVLPRLGGKSQPDLVQIALRVLEECDDGPAAIELTSLVARADGAGVAGEMKNLIFAADGPKPQFVFSDALNNDLKAIKNSEYCLIYDREVGAPGLTWRQLGDWWADHADLTHLPETQVWSNLLGRLYRSLGDNGAERRILDVYAKRYVRMGPDIPALIPQVYLHYDPYHQTRYGTGGAPLARQRMDFLLLMPQRNRVVIECDGVQHYADDEVLPNQRRYASPRRYAEMVAEDRALRLRGYEVYRFGGHELQQSGVEKRLDAFFDALDQRYAPPAG